MAQARPQAQPACRTRAASLRRRSCRDRPPKSPPNPATDERARAAAHRVRGTLAPRAGRPRARTCTPRGSGSVNGSSSASAIPTRLCRSSTCGRHAHNDARTNARGAQRAARTCPVPPRPRRVISAPSIHSRKTSPPPPTPKRVTTRLPLTHARGTAAPPYHASAMRAHATGSRSSRGARAAAIVRSHSTQYSLSICVPSAAVAGPPLALRPRPRPRTHLRPPRRQARCADGELVPLRLVILHPLWICISPCKPPHNPQRARRGTPAP